MKEYEVLRQKYEELYKNYEKLELEKPEPSQEFKEIVREYQEYIYNMERSDVNLNLQKLMQESRDDYNRIFNEMAEKIDVSSDLTEDARAKLQLIYGDFIVIPRDKLKDYVKDAAKYT